MARLLKALIVSSLLLVGAPAFAATDVAASIRKTCEKQVAAIKAAYAKKQYQQHVSLSAGFVKQLSKIPLSQLQPCEDVLIKAVAKDGAEPYATALIDHGHRLARISSKKNAQRHAAMARVIRPKLAKEKNKAVAGYVLLRASDRKGYRPYSGNVGYAVLAATYSTFGSAQYARGASPEQLLRFVEQYRACTEATGQAARTSKRLPALQRQSCDRLMAEFKQSFPGGGSSPSAPELPASIQGGITRGVAACLAAEDKGAQLIAQFEDYTECRANEQRQRANLSRFLPTGVMMGSTTTSPQPTSSADVRALVSGLTKTGEDHTSGELPGGGTWKQDDYTYSGIDANGNSTEVTISRSSKTQPGRDNTSATRISVDNNAGHTEYNYAGSGGGPERMTSMEFEGSDGSGYMAEFHSDGSRTEVAVDADGNSVEIETGSDGTQTITESDSAGNQTMTTVDANGKVVSTDSSTPAPSDSSELPPDEAVPSSCRLAPLPTKPTLTARGRGTAGLGPWIIPNPDSAPATATDSCLTAFISNQSTQQTTCPPSVAMCIEPPPPGSCGCGTPTSPAGVVPGGTGACAAINCGPEATCNASTGTCGSSSSGSVFPGIPNPPKQGELVGLPIKVNGPVQMRSTIAAPKGRWYPPATQPGLQKLLGTKPARGGASGNVDCNTTIIC